MRKSPDMPNHAGWISWKTLIPVFWILLFFSTENATAQIENKIEYEYKKKRNSVFLPSFFGYLFRTRDDLREDIRIRGADDSLMGENIIKVEHSNAHVVLYDIYGIEIVNDTIARFYGTWYEKTYLQDSNEMGKKIISRKDESGVIQLMKVQQDSFGRTFVKTWHRDSNVELSDLDIKSIKVRNYNYWVNNQKEEDRMVRRYAFSMHSINAAFFTGLFVLVARKYR